MSGDTTYIDLLVQYGHIWKLAEDELEGLTSRLGKLTNSIDEADSSDLDKESLSAAESVAEAMRAERKALLWILDEVESAMGTLERNQGPVWEARNSTPDGGADAEFYQ